MPLAGPPPQRCPLPAAWALVPAGQARREGARPAEGASLELPALRASRDPGAWRTARDPTPPSPLRRPAGLLSSQKGTNKNGPFPPRLHHLFSSAPHRLLLLGGRVSSPAAPGPWRPLRMNPKLLLPPPHGDGGPLSLPASSLPSPGLLAPNSPLTPLPFLTPFAPSPPKGLCSGAARSASPSAPPHCLGLEEGMGPGGLPVHMLMTSCGGRHSSVPLSISLWTSPGTESQ